MSHHSPFCFVFFLFFLTTKARFANIFEIKCNCFLKLNQQKELERYNLIFLNITFKTEDFVEKEKKKTCMHGLKNVTSNALKIKIDSKNYE